MIAPVLGISVLNYRDPRTGVGFVVECFVGHMSNLGLYRPLKIMVGLIKDEINEIKLDVWTRRQLVEKR